MLIIEILSTFQGQNVWVMLWELIVRSSFTWGTYQMPSSPYCMIYLWWETERENWSWSLMHWAISVYVTGAVNGSWSGWTAWTQCTEARYCLKGVTLRNRTCNNPPPINDGDDCPGVGEEERSCPTVSQGCEGDLRVLFFFVSSH